MLEIPEPAQIPTVLIDGVASSARWWGALAIRTNASALAESRLTVLQMEVGFDALDHIRKRNRLCKRTNPAGAGALLA